MPKTLYSVIGANYGDEGKGRAVDFLAEIHKESTGELPLIIRYNSGAQAGHTVQRGRKRHVFSHLGSATLQGADTLLCHHFVVNPMVFNEEWDELLQLGVTPQVYAGQECLVQSPFDALINRVRELSRSERHGSCGIGFGEACARREEGRVTFTVGDVDEYGDIDESTRERLIIDAQEQLSAIGNLDEVPLDPRTRRAVNDVMSGEYSWLYFTDQCKLFMDRAIAEGVTTAEVLGEQDALLFEGAQGLLLDRNDEAHFPHVTRSNTGSTDVVELITSSLQPVDYINGVKVNYVTRTYLTRHGAGPLPEELSLRDMVNLGYRIEDPTNGTNAWQGSLRFAELNVEQLQERIALDGKVYENAHISLNRNSVISGGDQAPRDVVLRVASALSNNSNEVWVGRGPDTEQLVDADSFEEETENA